MMTLFTAGITAIGSYVPVKRLTNADLESMVETTDEWIVQRTGIRERRIAAPDEYTSDLCIAAIANMANRYSVTLEDVDMILVCTHTPDFPFPTVSALLQDHFRIGRTGALDMNATCAGFVYGLHTANALIASGLHRKVLVVGADTMSKITDYRDRADCILFGDGAGAALVERMQDEFGREKSGQTDGPGTESSFLSFHLATDGSGGKHVYRTGLSKTLNGQPLIDHQLFVQNGREVYKWAVSTVPDGMAEVMKQSGMSLSEVDWFVPHSANMRIVESICEKSGFPLERTLTSLEQFGNTSAASIPLALDIAVRDGRVREGDRILLYGFGGGLVQAGMLLRWGALKEKMPT